MLQCGLGALMARTPIESGRKLIRGENLSLHSPGPTATIVFALRSERSGDELFINYLNQCQPASKDWTEDRCYCWFRYYCLFRCCYCCCPSLIGCWSCCPCHRWKNRSYWCCCCQGR